MDGSFLGQKIEFYSFKERGPNPTKTTGGLPQASAASSAEA